MGKNNQKQKPVAPIYAFGLTWLVCAIVFGWGVFQCLLAAFLVSKMIKLTIKNRKTKSEAQTPENTQSQTAKEPPKSSAESAQADKDTVQTPPSSGNPELDAVISEGHASVAKIQQLNDEIPDFKISAQLKQIEILTTSIIGQVEKKPEKLKEVRQFMNYYLPTTIKLLEQYVQMQNVGLRGDNITTGMQQIENLLDKVIVAFQKQLDSLFERDVVDITAEIQVMEQMMAAQGLTNQKDF